MMMSSVSSVMALALAVALVPACRAEEGGRLAGAELAARLRLSVVKVVVTRTEPPAENGREGRWSPRPPAQRVTGTGSGFIVDRRGFIVTNAHVIGNLGPGSVVEIRLSDRTRLDAAVHFVQVERDLALLRLSSSREDWPALKVAQGRALAELDEVVVAGYPFGTELSLRAGKVSGLDRHVTPLTRQEMHERRQRGEPPPSYPVLVSDGGPRLGVAATYTGDTLRAFLEDGLGRVSP